MRSEDRSTTMQVSDFTTLNDMYWLSYEGQNYVTVVFSSKIDLVLALVAQMFTCAKIRDGRIKSSNF